MVSGGSKPLSLAAQIKAPVWFVHFVVSAPLLAATQEQPNFVFILGEGHGWSSTSVQMDDSVPTSKSAFVRTPNLEKLAAGGTRIANFYAPSPRCTPSRVAFFTGKSPAPLQMTFINEGKADSGDNPNGRVIPPSASMELPTSETTIAEVLKRAGYATAHFGSGTWAAPVRASTASTKTTARTATAGRTTLPIHIRNNSMP